MLNNFFSAFRTRTRRRTFVSVLVLAGALLMPSCTPLQQAERAAQNAKPKFLYVAAAQDQQIYGYTVDPETGALTQIPETTGTPFAFFTSLHEPTASLAVDPSQHFLYANFMGTDFGQGSIVGYSIDPSTGALFPLTPYETDDPRNPVALAVVSGFLVSSNATFPHTSYTSFSINPQSGALKELSTFTDQTFFNFGVPRPLHVHPAGRFMVQGWGEGSAQIFLNQVDATTGQITVSDIHFLSREEDHNETTFDRTGRFVYASIRDAPDKLVRAWSFDGSSGKLTSIGTWKLSGAPIGALTASSKYVFAADGDNIQAFAIDTSTGKLIPAKTLVKTGANPVYLLLDPSEKFLYAANQDAGTVSAWSIGDDGTLTEISGSPFATGRAPQGMVMVSQ